MRINPELREETGRIEKILKEIKTIAIVGISRNSNRDSHYVGRYLQKAGYKIIPVNPGADIILGEKAYPSLASIPESTDAVNIFINPADAANIIEQAIDIQPKIIWLQLGAGTHPAQAEKANEAGIMLIENRCIKVDHQFLIRDKASDRQALK